MNRTTVSDVQRGIRVSFPEVLCQDPSSLPADERCAEAYKQHSLGRIVSDALIFARIIHRMMGTGATIGTDRLFLHHFRDRYPALWSLEFGNEEIPMPPERGEK